MTKEEILKKHFIGTEGYSEQNFEDFKKFKAYQSILNAMEEHAKRELFALRANYNILMQSHSYTVNDLGRSYEELGKLRTALKNVMDWFRYTEFGTEGEHFEDCEEYAELKELLRVKTGYPANGQ